MQPYHTYVLVYEIETGNVIHWTGPVSQDEVAAQARADRGWGAVAVDENPIKKVAVTQGDITYDVFVADIEAVRRTALRRVDDAAGVERQKHITTQPGQADVYAMKRADAEALKANKKAAAPFLRALAAATEQDVHALAADVLAGMERSTIALANIEALRITAKAEIAKAADLKAIIAAEAVSWPQDTDPAAENPAG